MTESKDIYNKEFYGQVSESIKSVFELTTRVDERVQTIMKKQDEMERKIDSGITNQGLLSSRVSVLESKNGSLIKEDVEKIKDNLHELELQMQVVKTESQRSEGRWKTIASFGLQLVWVILAAYILYRLGIQAPAVP